MQENNQPTRVKTPRFILSRQNQKGQVAIFVALIFQVIFVFFALLINVGLLVHQKINLQQSTDLAAYYGAMKQAELLNTIAHVNFQIKQAYKLLTWRYRILGTFGFKAEGNGIAGNLLLPYDNANPFTYNGNLYDPVNNAPPSMKCSIPTSSGVASVGLMDIPFFCVAHSGFKSWPGANETMCNVNCAITTSGRSVPKVADPGTVVVPGGLGSTIQDAVRAANQNLNDKCQKLGALGVLGLTRFLIGYITEVDVRTKTVEMLAKNLALKGEAILDLDGNKIFDGSKKTFQHNLTEANATGFVENDPTQFQVFNGYDKDGGGAGKCGFTNGRSGEEFLKKIEISLVNYFIHRCKASGGELGGDTNYNPSPLFSADPNKLAVAFEAGGGLDAATQAAVDAVKPTLLTLLAPGTQHTVGYEKNPFCIDYYAVKTTTTPNIPFLPLSKIKLTAVSIAKPFGGSIGPWYGKSWSKGSEASTFTDTIPETKTDENLPIRNVAATPGVDDINQSVQAQPNFSLFIGDKYGLRNIQYIAAYHSMLLNRDIKNFGTTSYEGTNPNVTKQLKNTGSWPEISTNPSPGLDTVGEWDDLDKTSLADFRQYDSLAKFSTTSGTRAIEITAIAPNQFDIYHYSIEPDFYHNYYLKLYKNFQKISDAVGGTPGLTADKIRPDFGAYNITGTAANDTPPFNEEAFSIRDQILVKNQVLNKAPDSAQNAPSITYSKILNFLVSLQSSVLTSWTFKNFSSYMEFPDGDEVNTTSKTMTFGKCLDEWNTSADAVTDPTALNNYRTPMNISPTNPPTPGNCVTGGRTGYSVKLITPNMVRDESLLENPIKPSFLSF